MKNNRLSLVILYVLVSIVLILPSIAGCAASTAPAGTSAPAAPATPAGQTYELKYTLAARGIIGEEIPTAKQWMDDVEKASNGKVKFKVLVGSTTDLDNYDAVVAGTGDFGHNLTAMSPGRFSIMDLMTICDLDATCKGPAQVAYDLWKAFPQEIEKEFSDIKLVGVWAAAPNPMGLGFGTVDKPIRTLADAKGVKMGMSSEFGMKTGMALGMVPAPAPPPVIYEQLQKKILDGSGMDPEMLDAFKLSEVIKYYHLVQLNFMPFWFGFNKQSWAKLPADIQKIILDEAAKIPGRADAYHTAAAKQAIDSAKAKYGLQIVEIDKAEMAKWKALQDPVQKEYLDKLKKDKNIDAQKIFDKLTELYAKYDK
ncbi:MAG: hypothetical protein A2Z02_04320 [Chloroflexi bacterium RBG_16_48_7]|nr:MAG: hypothetical protein A2Z02_04320 [Chloroflexi bacterium RBG_16_48_7]